MQNFVTNNVFLDTKVKPPQQQNKTENIKSLAGNWARYLSHPKRMRYNYTTESTESNECSQATLLFRRNGSKR